MKRSQNIADPRERGGADVVGEGEPGAPVRRSGHRGYRCACVPPMIINAAEQRRERDAPRGDHDPAGSRVERERRERRRRPYPPSARQTRAGFRDGQRRADAGADSNASCAPPRPARAARRAARASRVASATNGRNTSSGNHAGQVPARQPPSPNAAARKPSGTAPTSPMNIRAGGMFTARNGTSRRRQREIGGRAGRRPATPRCRTPRIRRRPSRRRGRRCRP